MTAPTDPRQRMPPEDMDEEQSSRSSSPELVLYIKHLDDKVGNYRRFFDSLLVKRPDHDRIFHDLRQFREQEHITKLLTQAVLDESLKQLYRNCTQQFLASRFAHPWCRNGYGNTKAGFLNTAKGKRKQAEAKRLEEDRFQQLLVPIWIAFRRRMTPTDSELATFLTEHEMKQEAVRKQHEEQQQSAMSTKRMTYTLAPLSEESEEEVAESVRGRSSLRRTSQFNAEVFVSEEDDLVDVPRQRSSDAAQAGGLFVGVAAASFLASNKRARKYLFKKLNKK